MKRTALFILLFLGVIASISASTRAELLKELEHTLDLRSSYSLRKEQFLDSLKQQLHPNLPDTDRFAIYNSIYEEYYTYRFDSAMLYVEKSREVALKLNNPAFLTRSNINRSILLTTSGFFSESIKNLEEIDRNTLDKDLIIEYYTAYEWAYSMWAEYANDDTYAPYYYGLERLYKDSLISVLPTDSKLYYYWRAEELYRFKLQYKEAEMYYKKALEGTPINVRLYAMAAFGLATVYERTQNWEMYEEYLIRAAISDQVCPLKENLALQRLALYTYKNEKEAGASRANRYLKHSLEDALFYKNRLRILGIASVYPDIVLAYQHQNDLKTERLQWFFVCTVILSLGLVLSLVHIYRQMKQIKERSNIQKDLNNELQNLNKELIETNHTREQYVSLFMHLCAAYIEKLNHYQAIVKRKVKAKQIDDLLKLVNNSRLSETDSKEFFIKFDTAFLNLYPNFIIEFNELLREDEHIHPKQGDILNTELRIFALIRMGIKDSSKIATLLFYSPQTIYNYRSAVKIKAKDKELFEKQVEQICQKINL
ncbi:MAG: DUF6377 domain-containing protein [Phocaeicola sp.]